MTNLASAAIMIVFAGGPHTPERTALACGLLASHPPPAIIYLTGAEYRGEYSNLAAQVRSIATKLPSHPKVLTDTCTTTWESCRYLARLLSTDHRQPSTLGAVALAKEADRPHITVITSNYHAPRVRWLFEGVLPSICQSKKEKSFEQKRAKTAKGGNFISAGGGDETSSCPEHVEAALCTSCPSVQNPNLHYPVSRFTLYTSPDIPWRKFLATPRNRQLILGEFISWLYCFPLGLIYHAQLLVLTTFLLAGLALIFRLYRRHHAIL